MAEAGTSESSSPDTDRDFDPSADMLVHDYDDEQTLEEEEALSGDSCCDELGDLEKEGDMPLEDLLAMYGYGGGVRPVVAEERQDTRSSSEEEILSNHDLTLDKDEIARDILKNSDDDDDKETTAHELLSSVSSSQTARLLRSKSQEGSDDDSESEEDVDYMPIEPVDDWKKTIQVGSDYQASVPDGLCKYGDAPAYENEDRLLWDPSKIEDPAAVEKYLEEVKNQIMQNGTGASALPTGAHVRDDEQALYMLLQCGHNIEEALRRRKMQAVPPTDPMSLWSEEECRNFENGLRTYGKDFYLIQQNKVKTRSVGELVQFYYLWKKTERHDVFANKNRIEKRKYVLHPGITDYMERFLDDQESPIPAPTRERSASPLTSLIYGDPKRNHLRPPSEGEGASSVRIEPRLLDVSGASPTVVTVSPDMKRKQTATSSSSVSVNGVYDTGEPVPKKLKTNGESSHYELQESYSDRSGLDSCVSSSQSCSTVSSTCDSDFPNSAVTFISNDNISSSKHISSGSVAT
ncbi:mesoderm induction early response protein 1-like isoform X2 [Ostrea edulis]|uniref:mesoderm induction early response protein 1-like isoform X2 n=1 Tax=Ostrea edulis TaxID=37623 RepID=UPI002095A40C|nr:mesoderm induction early response protein 1-like isoform X2 [Ostrea edulis]